MFQAELKRNRDSTERRRSTRYSMKLSGVCKVVGDKSRRICSDVCVTENLSSKGVLLRTGRDLSRGQLVELALSWPVRLNDTCDLQLVIQGPVVRSNGASAAVAIERYEFKTSRKNGAEKIPLRLLAIAAGF